jgi:hypothetical protein
MNPIAPLLALMIGILLKTRMIMRFAFSLISVVISIEKDRFCNKSILFRDKVFHLASRLLLQFKGRLLQFRG